MGNPPDRRFAVALACLLVVLAGCSGGGVGTATPEGADDGVVAGSSGGTATSTPTPTSTPVPTRTTTPTPGAESAYRFTNGEYYVYTVAAESGANRTLIWEVVSADDDRLTVNVSSNVGGTAGSTTLEATHSGIYARAANEEVAAFFVSLHFLTRVTAGHSLDTGTTWTVTDDELPGTVEWDRATVSVTGTRTVAGVECSTVELTPEAEGAATTPFCVHPDWPFALSVTIGTDRGRTTVSVSAFGR